MAFAVTPAGGIGSRVAIASWQVASSAEVGGDASAVSRAGFDARSWLVGPPRSTVLGALVASGECPDPYFSTNMRDALDPARFAVPWWFRSEFVVGEGGRTFIRLDGVNPRGDLFVNGAQVLDSSVLAGAYVVEQVEVTDLVHPGLNALALRVYPGNPMDDLSIGWVDWAPDPPDHNIGPWRDVVVLRTAAVRLGSPHVVTVAGDAGGPGGPGQPARLTATVEISNAEHEPVSVLVALRISGHGADVTVRREVLLDGGATERVRFGPDELSVDDPALWWPAGEGVPALYGVAVTASVDGLPSDHVESRFGIRTVDSEVFAGGGRRFRVNGRPVQLLGGGWSPDLLLRFDRKRLEAQLRLTLEMGLNTIRPEGKLENPEFYDLCDELGIMVLPGWECCTKWEAAAGTGGAPWDEHDLEIAARSMASEAELLRGRASVVGFLIGSDYAPPREVEARYVLALEAAGWDLPVVASATAQGGRLTGASGMKMTGPYDWVPPVYWYERDPELGGAVGFNSETSAGHTVPRLRSLRRMLSAPELDRLWQQPELSQYHSGPPSVFDNLGLYARAMSERYGPPRSAEDFAATAQLASYEAVRAQFEAFASRFDEGEPATGVVYWMLNSPWPSLNWQLFDYELDTPGSYWGAHKALERLHAFYAYDTETVRVLNRSSEMSGRLELTVAKRRVDGSLLESEGFELDPLEPGAVRDVVPAPTPAAVDGAWWLELSLSASLSPEGGAAMRKSRNVYWLSSTMDVLDPVSATWFAMDVSRFADFHAVYEMASREAPSPSLRASAVGSVAGSEVMVTVVVHNDRSGSGGGPAVGLHASVDHDGAEVLPVFWDDNDVTLFPGQAVSLSGRLGARGARRDRSLWVRVEGFNLRSALLVPVEMSPA